MEFLPIKISVAIAWNTFLLGLFGGFGLMTAVGVMHIIASLVS